MYVCMYVNCTHVLCCNIIKEKKLKHNIDLFKLCFKIPFRSFSVAGLNNR